MLLTKRIRAKSNLLLALLLLAGCGKKEIYEKIYDKQSAQKPIHCLHIEADDLTRYILLKNDFLRRLSSASCPLVLQATAHYVTSCKSAQAKALGSDFDGFLRLSVRREGRSIYRVQQDFKGCLNANVVNNLVQRMKERLHFALPHD